MILRRATPEDAAAVNALINPVISETVITFAPTPKTTQETAQSIEDTPHWLAEQDGGPLGYCSYGPFRRGAGYARTAEHSIVLAPAARGQGLGRQLIATLENHAYSQGIHSLIAGISGENDAALAFHAALGFTRVGHLPQVGHKFGRYIDLIFMQKMLVEP